MMQSLVSMPRDDHTQPFSLLISINSLCIGPQYASSLQDQFLLERYWAHAVKAAIGKTCHFEKWFYSIVSLPA